ncbi:MAG: hypothetical protein QF684_02715 [Candidatus Thalassarchaeaceae archaeon]|jgi:nicotinamide mononucleotide adenylyltransferase|nr:hypothetical protein [Candidatus Thalassarchaeaceae archaeon]
MEPAIIVLGRFQPFHNGHAAMINGAMSYLGVGDSDLPLRICIGSSQAEQSLDNPWSAEEREQMIRVWLGDYDAEIVHVPDLGDPPNYVEHAEKFHGPPGLIFTTDEGTSSLYRKAGWFVVEGDLVQREDWQGWRIRATMQMLSTVTEEEAAIAALCVNMPESVVRLLFANGWQRRLFHMGTGGEPVG